MEFSARNQLAGEVVRVDLDGPLAEVVIELEGGDRMTSVIESGAVERLGLRSGDDVDAVVKATDVLISKESGEET